MEHANYPGAVFLDLLERVSDGVYCVNTDGRITFWNASAAQITGYTPDEVLGLRCSSGFLHPVDQFGRQVCQRCCPLAAAMADGATRSAELYLRHKDGHRLAVTVSGHALVNAEGRVVGSAEVFSARDGVPSVDLQRRAPNESDDSVTGLLNRRLGELHLATLGAEVAVGRSSLGLLFVDVDHFKAVNDTHGHRAGDGVLRMVGRSMSSALRRSDLPIRWGGEEFVALLPGVDATGLVEAAERVRLLVSHSWHDHGGTRLRVTVSVGAALARPGESGEDLVDRADRLMYASKRAGRDRVTADVEAGWTGGDGPGEVPVDAAGR